MRIRPGHWAKLTGAQGCPAALCIGAVWITPSSSRKDGRFAGFNMSLRNVKYELEYCCHGAIIDGVDRFRAYYVIKAFQGYSINSQDAHMVPKDGNGR